MIIKFFLFKSAQLHFHINLVLLKGLFIAFFVLLTAKKINPPVFSWCAVLCIGLAGSPVGVDFGGSVGLPAILPEWVPWY